MATACALPEHSTSRRLGELESYFSEGGMTMRAAALVRGRIDTGRMRTAFEALVMRNPVLRSVVHRDERGYLLRLAARTPPVDVRRGNPRAFADEFAGPIDQTSHLIEFAVVTGRRETAVALTICHSISDMTALGAYLHELWRNYTSLVENGWTGDHRARSVPHGPEHWVRPVPARAPQNPVPPVNAMAVMPQTDGADVRERVHLEFSRATTDALRRVTKAHGTTVHAAVAGAVLTAERSLIAQARPLPMALRSSVDLRRRLPGTVVQPLEATAFIGMVTTQVHVDHDDSPLSVGRLVVDDIKNRIADGTAIASSVQPAGGQRPAVSYAANGGTVPDLPAPKGVVVEKVVFGSGKQIKQSAPLYYGSWTYSGRLNIDIGVPRRAMSPSARRQLADKIRCAIVQIASCDDEGTARPGAVVEDCRRRPRLLRALAGMGLALVFLLGLAPTALGCSRVTWLGSDGRVVTGRSMDWPDWFNEHLYVIPRGLQQDGAGGVDSLSWRGKYGAAVIAGSVVPDQPVDAAFDGMNEQGLVANMLYLGETDFGPAPTDHRPRLSVAGWVSYVLTSFGTVDEVVDAVANPSVYIVPTRFGPNRSEYPTVHLAVSDATGDSAIFEYLDGKVVVHHGRRYQVMTNSPTYDKQIAINESWQGVDRNQTLPGSVQPRDRFVRASYFLSRLPDTTDERQAVAGVFSVMRNVQVPWGGSGEERYATHWVSVADSTAKTLYFESVLSPNIVWLDLTGVDFSPEAGVRAVPLQENYSLIGDIATKMDTAEPISFLAP